MWSECIHVKVLSSAVRLGMYMRLRIYADYAEWCAYICGYMHINADVKISCAFYASKHYKYLPFDAHWLLLGHLVIAATFFAPDRLSGAAVHAPRNRWKAATDKDSKQKQDCSWMKKWKITGWGCKQRKIGISSLASAARPPLRCFGGGSGEKIEYTYIQLYHLKRIETCFFQSKQCPPVAFSLIQNFGERRVQPWNIICWIGLIEACFLTNHIFTYRVLFLGKLHIGIFIKKSNTSQA